MTNEQGLVDHERIWLQHEDDRDPADGRMWCHDKVWPEFPEEREPTGYVRADLFEAQSAQIAELQAEVERCHERLEITHYFVMDEGDELVRVEIPYAERGEAIDGITCRDATIRVLDRQIADLKRALDTARHDAMEEAAKVLEEGYDRVPGTSYRSDGVPSKNDQCAHGTRGWEDCEECAVAAIRRLSASPLSQGGQDGT